MHTVLDYVERTQEQIEFAKPNLEEDINKRQKLIDALKDNEEFKEFIDGLTDQINNEQMQLKRVERDANLIDEIKAEYESCDDIQKAHVDSIIDKYFTILNIRLTTDESEPA